MYLGFVSAYLKWQWLHCSACFDPLLSLWRWRIRTPSCRSAWSWWRSCSRCCGGRRCCLRWRLSWRRGWLFSPRCCSVSPGSGCREGLFRAVPLCPCPCCLVHTGAQMWGSCCPFDIGALPECQTVPASVSSLLISLQFCPVFCESPGHFSSESLLLRVPSATQSLAG